MTMTQRFEKLQEIFTQTSYLNSIGAMLGIDQWGSLPKDGVPFRLQVNAFLGEKMRELYLSEEAEELSAYFDENREGRNLIETVQIREFMKKRGFYLDVPKELSEKFDRMKVEAMNAWKQAREEQDFKIFAPYMEQVFQLRKEIALALRPNEDPFATLVDLTDEGMKVDKISEQFSILREGIVDILEKIRKSDVQIQDDFLQKEQNPEEMMEFAKSLAREIGYEEDKGGYNEKVIHAFSSTVGPRDARVSTYKNGFVSLLLTILHESGHSMYGYSSCDEVVKAGLYGGVSGGFHEGQARFIENMIGRNQSYIHHIYPELIRRFPDFKGISELDFYKALNKVTPSPIRTKADEVTYSLHVIIRFELERDWFAGKLTTDQMRDAWNDKYESYLGIRPENDTEGILQDMHWTGDWIGYFQSYALGNIYDGQINEAIRQDIPDFDQKLTQGQFKPITDWLTEHIWCYGKSKTGGELIEGISGHGLDAEPFIKYLDRKYGEIYGWA